MDDFTAARAWANQEIPRLLLEVRDKVMVGMIKEDFIIKRLGLHFCKHSSRTNATPKGYKCNLKYQIPI